MDHDHRRRQNARDEVEDVTQDNQTTWPFQVCKETPETVNIVVNGISNTFSIDIVTAVTTQPQHDEYFPEKLEEMEGMDAKATKEPNEDSKGHADVGASSKITYDQPQEV